MYAFLNTPPVYLTNISNLKLVTIIVSTTYYPKISMQNFTPNFAQQSLSQVSVCWAIKLHIHNVVFNLHHILPFYLAIQYLHNKSFRYGFVRRNRKQN